MPWSAMQIHHRVKLGPLKEAVCAENHGSIFNDKLHPMSEADKPDF
jgi:hypothetical protein